MYSGRHLKEKHTHKSQGKKILLSKSSPKIKTLKKAHQQLENILPISPIPHIYSPFISPPLNT